jgi:hypothetical protein
MAWPRRGTRKIVIDAEDFLWHYDACCPWCSNDVFTAGKAGVPYVLFIDPFPWGAEFRPRFIAAAIRWARQGGWSAESGPTRALALNDATQQFQWLEPGQRHLGCLGPAPANL